MNRIVLASTSPRRKELLMKAGIDVIVDAFSIDEIMDESLPITARLIQLAKDKGYMIAMKYPDDLVIAADTVIEFEGRVITKAKDRDDARNILSQLSQRHHQVYTAVALFYQNKIYTFCERTDVYFHSIDNLIDAYLDSEEWVGKAGAYAIQGEGKQFVKKIIGDYETVVGLPVAHTKAYIDALLVT